MFSDERRQQIIDIVKQQKFINVPELAKKFYTSEATIRRDLDKLKKTGLLKRTYGGAVLIEGIDSEIPLVVREEERTAEKELIAKAAAELIREDDVIIIDSSSTCAKLVPFLAHKKPKTVITNSPKTAIQLSGNSNINIYNTGGFLRSHSLSCVGEAARNMISSLYVDTLFFSCRGASLTIGLLDPSEEEAELKRIMIKHARTRVVMLDSTKLKQTGFARICDFSDIDCIVTEERLSDEWTQHLSSCHVKILYPH